MTDYILLGFLMYGEMNGYTLKKVIGMGPSHFYDASFGSIYPSLARLEREGKVTVRESYSGKRQKKYYRITKTGESSFRAWLKEGLPSPKAINGFLLRVFFFEFLEKEEARLQLEAFRSMIRENSEKLKSIQGHVEKGASSFQYATLDFGLGYYGHIDSWVEGMLNNLDAYPDEDRRRYLNVIVERGGRS